MRRSRSAPAPLALAAAVALAAIAVCVAACGGFKNEAGADGGTTGRGDASTGDASGTGDAPAAPDGTPSADGGEGGSEAGNEGRPCTAAACPPVVMAAGLHFPVSIAVDATYLYWIEAGNGVSDPYAPLVRIAKDAPCLASTDPCRGVLDPMAGGDAFTSLSIAVGPGQVCYTQTYDVPAAHSVNCVAFGSGGGTRGVYQGAGAAVQIVTTGDTIAWTDFGQDSANSDGALFAVPADAGFLADAQPLLARRPGPAGIAADGDSLVWTEYGTTADAGTVLRTSADGGAPLLAAGQQVSPAAVAAYGGYVYWANAGDGTVRRAKDDGSGGEETIASGENVPFAVAADATGVTWIDQGTGPDYLDGALRTVPAAGGTPTTMISGIVNVQSLAVDDSYAYVCTAGTTGGKFHDGNISRIARTY